MLMKRERKHRINQVQTSLFSDLAKKIARGAFAVSHAVRVKICKMSVYLFIQYNLGFLHVDKLSFFVILCFVYRIVQLSFNYWFRMHVGIFV